MKRVVAQSVRASIIDSRNPLQSNASPGRLIWLDLVRLFCALQILGIHWLRACYKVGLFGSPGLNLVINYQGHNSIAAMLPRVLIAGTSTSASVWLTNLIGLLGGFGWEGVSALIIVSGFSLTISMKTGGTPRDGWSAWIKKRIKRILVPFYIVAAPFLIAYGALLFILPHFHSSFAAGLLHKLQTLLETPPLGVVLSHTLMFDPYSRQWQAQMFAPAWWFIPAILVAYVAFPAFLHTIRRVGRVPVLIAAAAITLFSYRLANDGIFINESWYFIIMQECFNFSLGIAAGEAWRRENERESLDHFLSSRGTFAIAMVLFAAGNIANWSSTGRMFASMLYGPGLLLVGTSIAKRIEGWRTSQAAVRLDAYDLYLVHQPFAFPLALAMKIVLPAYAVFAGSFVFVAIAAIAATGLAWAERRIFRRRIKATILSS